MIWTQDEELRYKQVELNKHTQDASIGPYLRFVPRFEVVAVLQCDPLVIGSHVLHHPGQVLALRGVDVHVDGRLGDLGTQLSDILLRGEIDRQ